MKERHVLLYDGVCGLCDRLTRFVIRRDGRRLFRFASLQSAVAADVLARYAKDPGDLDTLYVVRRFGTPSESLLSRSEAVLFVLRELRGFWRVLAGVLGVLPSFVLDSGYRVVARYRYRVFGRYQACPIPGPSEQGRFLEEPRDHEASRLLVNR